MYSIHHVHVERINDEYVQNYENHELKEAWLYLGLLFLHYT